jgi:hypothetical protein
MPAIKRMMDVAIVALARLDLVLTDLFFSPGSHPPRAPSPQQAVFVAPLPPATAAVATATASASFLLLRAPDISGMLTFVRHGLR